MRVIRMLAAAMAAALTVSCMTLPPGTEPPADGVWTGALPIGPGDSRDFTVQLHERADQSLIGYLLGGTSYRTLLSGERSGDTLTLVFELRDSGLTRTIILDGALSGDMLTGTADDGAGVSPASWTRIPGPVEERKFIFVESMGGDDALTELAVALDAGGALISGGFVGGGCDLIACGGGVTSFSETPGGDLTIGVETGGSCGGTGSITATFDAMTSFYGGAWTLTDDGGCGGGAIGGSLNGGRDMGAHSDHVASVLGHLGQIADDLESGAAFASPYAPVSSSYLHFGATEADFLAELSAEAGAHPSGDVEFGRFTALRTVAPAGLNPFLSDAPMVSFRDHREDFFSVYRDVEANAPAAGAYRHLVEEGGAWRLVGNQIGEFDLPFPYVIGAERLLAPMGSGADAGDLHVSLGGWGAHFGPLTGHLEGNGKADLFAQYAGSAAELTELVNGAGGAPGVCEPDLVWSGAGELCGSFGGPTGDIIRERRLRYQAPYDGEVVEILYEERPRPLAAPETHYFENPPHWSARIRFEGGLTIRFVHLGQISGAVRTGMIAATGVDPDGYVPSANPADPDFCPPSPARCEVDVLGGASFSISAGDEIAIAQTDAAEIPGHPGFFRGQIGPSIPPWSQVEFFVSEAVGVAGDPNVCVYQYLPTAKQADMADAMSADMLNPGSLRYGETSFVRPWKFRAEAELCNNGGHVFRNEQDFSSIHAQLGGWYERPAPGTTADEQFTVARIHQDAGAYSSALYDDLIGSIDPTEYLVGRARVDGGPLNWNVPGVGLVNVWTPTGEVLELTASSFVVKWRELGPPPGAEAYQRAAYELDPEDGLKIEWGALSATLVGAVAPVLAPGEACDDVAVLCYGHTRP